MGHMGHIPLINHIRGGHIPTPKNAPDLIQNRMFLPQMKKLSWEAISYNKIFCPPLVCYAPGAEFFHGEGVENLFANFGGDSAPDENIS